MWSGRCDSREGWSGACDISREGWAGSIDIGKGCPWAVTRREGGLGRYDRREGWSGAM